MSSAVESAEPVFLLTSSPDYWSAILYDPELTSRRMNSGVTARTTYAICMCELLGTLYKPELSSCSVKFVSRHALSSRWRKLAISRIRGAQENLQLYVNTYNLSVTLYKPEPSSLPMRQEIQPSDRSGSVCSGYYLRKQNSSKTSILGEEFSKAGWSSACMSSGNFRNRRSGEVQ